MLRTIAKLRARLEELDVDVAAHNHEFNKRQVPKGSGLWQPVATCTHIDRSLTTTHTQTNKQTNKQQETAKAVQAVVTFEYTSSRQRCLEVYRPGTWAWLCQAHALRLAGKRVTVRGEGVVP